MRTSMNRMMARWMPPMKPAAKSKKRAVEIEDKTKPLEPAPYADDWFLVMTDPRAELAAVDALRRAGFRAWAPQMFVIISSASVRRKVKVNRPLFPRYVFVSDEGCRVTKSARFCDHVSMLVQQGAIRAPWAVVRELSDRQSAGEFDATVPAEPTIAAGDTASFVLAGQLFEGVVTKAEHERVFMLVDLFGKSRIIQVSQELLTVDAKSG